jgi:hypothetical protein
MLKLTLPRVKSSTVRMRANRYNIDQSPGNATSTLEGPLRHASTSQTAAAKGTSALQLQVTVVLSPGPSPTRQLKSRSRPIYHLSATCHLSSVIICHL